MNEPGNPVAQRLDKALSLFTTLLWLELAYIGVRFLFFSVVIPVLHVGGDSWRLIEQGEGAIGVGLGVLAVVVWSRLVGATDPEKHAIVRVGLVLTVLSALLDVSFLLPMARGFGMPMSLVTMVLFASLLPVSFYTLLGLWNAERRPRPTSVTSAMWALFVTRLVLGGVRSNGHELIQHFGTTPALFYAMIGYSGTALSIASTGLLLWLVTQLRGGLATSDALAPTFNLQQSPAPQSNDVVVGLMWLIGGIAVTVVSYSIASSGTGGGRYFISTGAVAYGIGRLVRGLGRR